MSFTASSSMRLSSSKTLHFASPLGMHSRPRTARLAKTVCSASERNEGTVAPVVAASVAASLALPDFAQATALTPSVTALLQSVAAGVVIAALILGAVTLVANFDPIARK